MMNIFDSDSDSDMGMGILLNIEVVNSNNYQGSCTDFEPTHDSFSYLLKLYAFFDIKRG